MKPYFTYICILIMLLAVACNTAPHETAPAPQLTADIARLNGTWYNDEHIFGCMHLEIGDSGRFTFFEEGTTMKRYSQGICRRKGNHIQFTSLDKYRVAAIPAPSSFNPDDTVFIYLDNEQYLLENDTLFKLDANGEKADARFHR